MFSPYYHYKAYAFIVGTILLTICGCKTAEAPIPRGKLPERESTAPRYQTDEELAKEISAIKKKLESAPNDTDLLLRLGALQTDVKDTEGALVTLEKLRSLNYTQEPKIYATLGALYDQEGEFEKSKAAYQDYKSLLSTESPQLEKTKQILEHLNFKIELLQNKYDITLQPLPAPINTDDSEYLSQFTIDGNELIFIRRDSRQEDLFLAQKEGDNYIVSPIEELNTPGNEGTHTISADGSYMIFTHCSKKFGYGGCDLYSTQRRPDGTWTKPANLGTKVNTRHWESQPALSPDGSLLIYTSTQPDDNRGGSDIHVSRRLSSGGWSVPVNAGSVINTKGREESPFFHPDGKTLYFRSNGHPSLGGFDLFMSQREEGGWGEVVNLGSPINTQGNDGALVVSLDGRTGYYATDNYNGQPQDNLDIYSFELPEAFRPNAMTYVKGRVTNDKGLPLEATIHIEYLEDLPIKSNYTTNANGEFLAAIPVGIPTLVNIESDGYAFYSDHVSYDEVRYGVDPYELDIALSPIIEATETESAPIVLKNIFFESASATLKESSLSEINYLKDLLIDNPSIRIKIVGHTDDIGTEEDNKDLSQARAESVKDALTTMGISMERIIAEGAGESSPIATNDTDEGRAANRRTEFIIIRG